MSLTLLIPLLHTCQSYMYATYVTIVCYVFLYLIFSITFWVLPTSIYISILVMFLKVIVFTQDNITIIDILLLTCLGSNKVFLSCEL